MKIPFMRIDRQFAEQPIMNQASKNVLLINLGWEQTPYIDIICQLGANVFGVHSVECEVDPRLKDVLFCDFF